jgi:type IV pilus assembly protein PilO
VKDKLYISVFISILIVAGYYYLVPAPADSKSNEGLQKEIAEMEGKLNSGKNTESGFSQKDEINAEISNLKQEMRQIAGAFPADADLSSLLRNLSSLGDTCGLQFLLFEPQKTNNEGFYEEIPIKLKLRGTFRQVASFFDGVSRMERLIAFEGIKIAGYVKTSGTDVLTETDAVLVTYRLLGEM